MACVIYKKEEKYKRCEIEFSPLVFVTSSAHTLARSFARK